MEIKNAFYIFRESNYEFFHGLAYDLETGISFSKADSGVIPEQLMLAANKLELNFSLHHSRILALKWNRENSYLGYDIISDETAENVNIVYNIPAGVYSIAFMFDGITTALNASVNEAFGYKIIPHYKKLEKKFKKESGQAFFRESLDGKITLWGTGYELIRNASLEDSLLFKVYRNDVVYASASFNKSDCKFDHVRKSVELSLKHNDKYSKILDAYENTYDLIKLAPKITQLTLTKRCVSQIYIQGGNSISNYAGGTYWETEVDEPIDDENALTRKYFFTKGPKYVEISLHDFNYDINAAYRVQNSDCWNAVSYNDAGQRAESSIKFAKVASADDLFTGDRSDVMLMSSGKNDSNAATYTIAAQGGSATYYKYDTYRIEIYSGKNATGKKLYQSDKLYGKDNGFTISAGDDLYPMSLLLHLPLPSPAKFNLGSYAIEYQIWGRLLCDVDQSSDGQQTYDLPYDDFATPRRNYKKCIGITGFDTENSVIKIIQSQQSSEEPTAYGLNDFGKYFVAPYTIMQSYYHPLARSTWANTSLWVELDETLYPNTGYEVWCQKYYKKYTLKNSYHIADVIKVLISQIDSTITHENAPEYSQFLYGHSGASANALGNCDIYITQKTNILKGEYDQAAQKAEIQLKQVMEMLRDCFRCYWFIDDQNRLRIEHISYFMNGLSYGNQAIQFDLTSKLDKFNKAKVSYYQQETEFDKSDLSSRYEFAWSDDVTEAMGGDLHIDVNNKYIQKDKKEEINIDGFTSDIDYMLFLPDDFSNDGFALLMANSNKEVPIIRSFIKEEKQYDRLNPVSVQNWYASFNQLANHYMYDMPGYSISYNNINTDDMLVFDVKKCVKHEIEFSSNQIDIDINKLIATEIGNGSIEEMSTNIDTDMTKLELRYRPD